MRLARRVRVFLALRQHSHKGLPSPANVYAPPSIRSIRPRVHSAPASDECTHMFMISPMCPIDSGPSAGV